MSKTVCFTGHRYIPVARLGELAERLDRVLARLYAAGYRTYITGGADGFDTLAALRIIELRRAHPDVRLVVAIPY